MHIYLQNSFVCAFIHSLNKYIQSSDWVPDVGVKWGMDTAVNKAGKVPGLLELVMGRQSLDLQAKKQMRSPMVVISAVKEIKQHV